MSTTCRNQGMALPERACGYCHEGPCPWDEYVILRRPDYEALDEEWALSDDPFFRPLKLVEVEHPDVAPQGEPEPPADRCDECGGRVRGFFANFLRRCPNDWHIVREEWEHGLGPAPLGEGNTDA